MKILNTKKTKTDVVFEFVFVLEPQVPVHIASGVEGIRVEINALLERISQNMNLLTVPYVLLTEKDKE